jgi:hypothetical protein
MTAGTGTAIAVVLEVSRRRFAVPVALSVWLAACGSDTPTGPSSTPSLPFVRETATMRIYYESGDTVDAEWQEAYNAWVTARLGVQPPKVEYRKYQSRDAMGRYTGNYNTNGFAEPDQWRLHTIWPRDNHEIVHLYTAPVGRPSDFFNEGLAVAFQTDPAIGRFDAWFNGVEVHAACRDYLRDGRLPLPVADYATTQAFRAIPDQVLSYRYAGSFVRFLVDRYGLPVTLDFVRGGGGRDESLAAIRARAATVFGRSLDGLESEWLAFLRG